jgi:hypothetical protein
MIPPRLFSEKLIEYSVAVTSWDYFYSYIADPLTRDEVDALEFRGRLVDPRNRGHPAKVLIACEKDQRDGEPVRYNRPVLGNLVVKKRFSEAYVLLPSSHVIRLIAVASSGRIRTVRFTATKLFRNKALIRSIGFLTET